LKKKAVSKSKANRELPRRSVILATGVKHRHLNIEGEDKYLGHGVSYCAVCDGPFYAGKDVMVIGDANSALQYAILLAAQCPHVDVVTLFDKFFADDVLVKGLKSLQNVTITHNMSSLSFNGDGKNLTSVSFKTPSRKKRKTSRPLPPSSRLANSPTTSVSPTLVELKKGFIVTDESMATKTARHLRLRRLPRQEDPPVNHRLWRWRNCCLERFDLRLQPTDEIKKTSVRIKGRKFFFLPSINRSRANRRA
jgi:alkyl hydroperoxide reductase subunit AhpF